MERLWLIGWRCSGSLDGDVVANCIQMWCLIGWRFGGSLDGNVVAHGGDVMAQ